MLNPNQHLGHHLGPRVEAPPYEDADMYEVALRLDMDGIPLNREGSHD